MCLSIMKRAIVLVIILIVNIALNAFSLQYDHCGERLIKSRSLIVGGKISRRGMWPWQVGIYKKQEVSGWQFLCGGALVSPQWVLTAAHCFYVEKNTTNRVWFEQDIKTLTKYKIKVGDHELRSYESSEQEHQFQEIFVHPDYRHDPIFENDIALVKLNREVILGPYVRTVCLPGPDLDLAKPGTAGMVAGWGITESGYGSSFLRYSSFTIETDNVCGRAIRFYYNKTVAFCASDVKGHSAPCYGDSGGSMVRKLFLNGKYRYVTIGLVSWGGCSLGNHYGYYTRLQPFLPWIYHKVNSTCMGPTQLRNGVITPAKSIYQPNEVIRFTCNINYTKIGKSELTCQRDGTWNGYKPLCLAPCPKPAQPKNGIQLGNSFGHGHIVWFRCSTGLKLIGSSITTCSNGKWTNKTPKCAAPCPDPGTPIDGHRYNHSFQHGDQVMFSCEKGKYLIGRKIITCNDGRWDQMTPTCALKITDKCTFIQPSSCGVSPTSFRARMVGGNKAGRGTWPWQVGIHRLDFDGNLVLKCGGALIGKQWVLIAAHCFYGINTITMKVERQIIPPSLYTVKVGDYHMKVRELAQVDLEAEAIYIHQSYRDHPFYENDIALIKLREEVKLGPFVRTVCLPKNGENLLQPGKHGYVAGWGTTQVLQPGQRALPNKVNSQVLLHSAFKVQSNVTCKDATTQFFNPSVTFCAGDGKGGNDTCIGDSGGSFVRESKQSDGKWRWVSMGLVSWGEGCGLRGKYTYYTRVEPFVDWIKETIQRDCKERNK